MDGKNVLMAIILSTIVLVGWATIFEQPESKKQISQQETLKKDEDISSPSLDNSEIIKICTCTC